MSDEQTEDGVDAPVDPPKKVDGRVHNRLPKQGPGGTKVGTKKVDPAAGWGAFSDAWARGVRGTTKLARAAGCSTKTIKRYIARLQGGEKPGNPDKITTRIEPALDKPPEPTWDHMEVASRAAVTDRLPVPVRLQAVRILEERRRWEAEHGHKGLVDWATVGLEDIPHEHRARLAGLLAETLVEERAPHLGLAETTEAQATAYYQTGRVLRADEAEEIVRLILAPALAAAVKRADEFLAARELAAAADGPRDSELRAEDFLTHV